MDPHMERVFLLSIPLQILDIECGSFSGIPCLSYKCDRFSQGSFPECTISVSEIFVKMGGREVF